MSVVRIVSKEAASNSWLFKLEAIGSHAQAAVIWRSRVNQRSIAAAGSV